MENRLCLGQGEGGSRDISSGALAVIQATDEYRWDQSGAGGVVDFWMNGG